MLYLMQFQSISSLNLDMYIKEHLHYLKPKFVDM
jgi:hypothetical protein